MKDLRLVILTGMSGSGKSTVIKVLEDLGFFCVDNLPVALLPKFVELCLESSGEITKAALVIDLREREFFGEYPAVLGQLKETGIQAEIMFLEASDSALIKRFQVTRRPHPLAGGGSVLDGIREERERLRDLKRMAAWVIDTSDLNVHQLRGEIQERVGFLAGKRKLALSFISFGFRHGTPFEADLIMDVRFLPNPYFVPGLKELSGDHEAVADFVLAGHEAKEFMERLEGLIDFLLPLYEREGKSYLTVAIGCTGGRHRSVTVVSRLARSYQSKGYQVRLRHRDAAKEDGD